MLDKSQEERGFAMDAMSDGKGTVYNNSSLPIHTSPSE